MTKKTIRKKNLINFERIEKWTDEEVLTNMVTLLKRAKISAEFVEGELGGEPIITHQVLCIASGDKAIFSEPEELEWPLQVLPMPDALKN